MFYNRIPGIGEVRLDEAPVNILPIFRSPYFQMLRHRKQLGQVHLVFPGATHSRLEHSLGTFARTREVLMRWHSEGLLNMQDVITGCVYAVLHDIGHPPFSHTIEPLLKQGHHAIGMDIIRRLSLEIVACGTTPEAVMACFQKTHPVAAAVSDGSLGIDRLDYLWRDAHHTGFGGIPEISMVASSLTMRDGKLLLRKRSWQEAMALVAFSHRMFERVYESSKSAYARRLIQKMYERLEHLNMFQEADLVELTDARLEGLWGNADDRGMNRMYQSYSCGWRIQTGLVICKKPYGESYARREKTDRVVHEMEPEEFDTLAKRVTWQMANTDERQIADALDQMNPYNLFLVPSREERRYRVPNITLLDGTVQVPIAEVDREQIERINAGASRVSVIRVGTNDPEALKKIVTGSDTILEIFRQWMAKPL